MIKSVLTIAGSDSGGGAGIQADLKSFAANGVYGASVITAITAQNTLGVSAVEALSAKIVNAQLEAVFSDLSIEAIKIGMVADQEIMHVIAKAIDQFRPSFVVIDPVMVSTTGHRLLEIDQIEVLKKVLLPLATVVTPNLQEAEVMLGKEIRTMDEMKAACQALAAQFDTNVLLKGGHFPLERNDEKFSIDILSSGETFESDWIETDSTHGTGCSLSSALCANLAKGENLIQAVANAKDFVHEGIRQAFAVGEGSNPIHHFHQLWK